MKTKAVGEQLVIDLGSDSDIEVLEPNSPPGSSKTRAATAENDIITIDDDEDDQPIRVAGGQGGHQAARIDTGNSVNGICNSFSRVWPSNSDASEGTSKHYAGEYAEASRSTRGMQAPSTQPTIIDDQKIWSMITRKANELRAKGTSDGKAASDAVLLFRQLISYVIADVVNNRGKSVDDSLAHHLKACCDEAKHAKVLWLIHETTKELAASCLKELQKQGFVNQTSAERHKQAPGSTRDTGWSKAASVHGKEPFSIGGMASESIRAKAAEYRPYVMVATKAVSASTSERREQMSVIPANPTNEGGPSAAAPPANKPSTPPPTSSSHQQRADSADADHSITNSDTERPAAETIENANTAGQSFDPSENRGNDAHPSPVESSMTKGPDECFECEEVIDADSVTPKDDVLHDDGGNACEEANVSTSSNAVSVDTVPAAKDSSASARGRGRSPTRKRTLVSPGKSRSPFGGSARTKSSPPRDSLTRFANSDSPETSGASCQNAEDVPSPPKKPFLRSSKTIDLSPPESSNVHKMTLRKRGLDSGPSSSASEASVNPANTAEPTAKIARQLMDMVKQDVARKGRRGRPPKSSLPAVPESPAPSKSILKRHHADDVIELRALCRLKAVKRRVSWAEDVGSARRYPIWSKLNKQSFDFPHSPKGQLISVASRDKRVKWDPAERTDPTANAALELEGRDKAFNAICAAADSLRKVEFAYETRDWIITDTLLKGLRDDVLHQPRTLLTRLEWPALPSMLRDALDAADVNRDMPANHTNVSLSHIFVVLGFDLALYYRPEDHGPHMVLAEVQKLLQWFRSNVEGNNIHRVKHPKLVDGSERRITINVSYLATLPQVVLVTIPEVGHHAQTLHVYNEALRYFAGDYNSENTDIAVGQRLALLDWAELCHSKPEEARTHEGRVRLLFDEANLSFGVQLVSNAPDEYA